MKEATRRRVMREEEEHIKRLERLKKAEDENDPWGESCQREMPENNIGKPREREHTR
jgi:hypothetical protein